MDTRLAKQILYGAGFVVFFILIISAIYLIWFKPASGPIAVNPIPQNLSPIQTDWIKYFPAGNQSIIAAEIKNPNLDYASDYFAYAISIYAKDGSVLQTINNNSVIYAAEIKNIVETASVSSSQISDVKIDFADIDWKSENDFPAPQVQTRSIQTTIGTDLLGPTITGYITNNNAYSLGTVKIIGLLNNSSGNLMSASKTESDGMNAFEERPFTVNFPNNVVVLTPNSSAPAFTFNKSLSLGMKNNDVLNLQKFLYNQNFLISQPTNIFNRAAQTALIKYQKAVGISPANGSLGPKTRAAINAELTNEAIANAKNNPSVADPAKTQIYVEAIR